MTTNFRSATAFAAAARPSQSAMATTMATTMAMAIKRDQIPSIADSCYCVSSRRSARRASAGSMPRTNSTWPRRVGRTNRS